MKYSISKDITTVCKLLNISYSELAKELGVARSTIMRIVSGQTYPSDMFLELFYSFAYENRYHNLRINEFKIRFAKENHQHILFHGARSQIELPIDLNHSRKEIDIGCGFYLGESFEQSSSYIFSNLKASIYLFDVSKTSELKIKELETSLEWMLIVSYFRGQLDSYKESKVLKKIIDELDNYDIIIAPIADNNMYETMNQFARGDITDQQAIYALSASHLGKQHVLKTKKACQCVEMVDRLYLCKNERKDIENKRREVALEANNKAKQMIEANRRIGKYVEEILQ